MEEICKAHLNEYKEISNSEVWGFIKSKEKYESFLLDLISHGFAYSTRSSGTDSTEEIKAISFESGIPYMNIRRLYLKCSHGDRYYEIGVSKSGGNNQDHTREKKRRVLKQSTKKIGCQSKINVKVRQVYPEYAADPTSQTKWMKMKISKELKRKISENWNFPKETWYFMQVFTEHNHEITGGQIPLHRELTSRIEELVECGITSIPKIKLYLKEKVSEIFEGKHMPDSLNRAFYPKDSTIYYHVNRTLFSMKEPNSEQDLIANEMEIWEGNDESDQYVYEPFQVEEPNEIPTLHQEREEKLSGPQQNTPNRLFVLREKLKNMIQMSYNLEEGEYLESILTDVSSLEKNLGSHQKILEYSVLRENINLKRKNDLPVSDSLSSELPVPPKYKIIHSSKSSLISGLLTTPKSKAIRPSKSSSTSELPVPPTCKVIHSGGSILICGEETLNSYNEIDQ